MQIEVVNKSLTYAGRTYAVGDTLDMADKYANLFILLGNVRLCDEDAKSAPKSKRRYRRRDMSAEA